MLRTLSCGTLSMDLAAWTSGKRKQGNLRETIANGCALQGLFGAYLNTSASTEGDPVNSAPPNLRLCLSVGFAAFWRQFHLPGA